MMVAGNTGAVAVANSLLMRLQLTVKVVDTRVDDDITQFVLVALFTDGAAAVVVVVNVAATVVATVAVVVVVVDYGSG